MKERHTHTASEGEGSALVTVLAIIGIVTVLTATALTAEGLHRTWVLRTAQAEAAWHAAESGVAYARWRLRDDPDWRGGPVGVELGRASTTVHIEPYGAFLRCRSIATVGTARETLDVLLARAPGAPLRRAIVLRGTASNLALTGSTHVAGPVAFAGEAVRMRPWKGRRFTGAFEGEHVRSGGAASDFFGDALLSSDLFELRLVGTSHPRTEHARGTQPKGTRNGQPRRGSGEVLAASFLSARDTERLKGVRRIISKGALQIRGPLTLPHGVRIEAQGPVQMTGLVRARRALIISRGSIAGSGLYGSFQLFSERAVQLTGRNELTAPSIALAKGDSAQVQLSGETAIDGWVIAEADSNRTAQVKLGSATLLRGAAYSSDYLNVSGALLGTAIARAFRFYEAPSYYVNWLRDATIDLYQRPAPFFAPRWQAEDAPWVIVDRYAASHKTPSGP